MPQYSKTEDGRMCKCIPQETKIYRTLDELQYLVDVLKSDLEVAQNDLQWAKDNGVKGSDKPQINF